MPCPRRLVACPWSLSRSRHDPGAHPRPPHHVAVGAATDAVFARLAQDGGPGLRRLVHGALPETVFRRFNGHREREGLPPWDPTAVYHLRGVPDEQIGITVDTSAVADRVRRGFLEKVARHPLAARSTRASPAPASMSP